MRAYRRFLTLNLETPPNWSGTPHLGFFIQLQEGGGGREIQRQRERERERETERHGHTGSRQVQSDNVTEAFSANRRYLTGVISSLSENMTVLLDLIQTHIHFVIVGVYWVC